MYDPLNRRKPNARAFKCIGIVQALKHSKQFIHVLHIKADAIVPNEYDQVIAISVGAADLDFGLRARAREFNRVGDKVNQYQP
jgi:hypothetical protein